MQINVEYVSPESVAFPQMERPRNERTGSACNSLHYEIRSVDVDESSLGKRGEGKGAEKVQQKDKD